MQFDKTAVWRLSVVAEPDPGALIRVLQFFQERNLIPQYVGAQRIGAEFLEILIDIDAAECKQEEFRLIIAKINELPVVLVAIAASAGAPTTAG